MPDVLHGVPGRGEKQVPKSDWAAYAPPHPVPPVPVNDREGITVSANDLQAFATPAAPQGMMPQPSLPLGGRPPAECQHPFAVRWTDPVTDVEGCRHCAKSLTPNGWVIKAEWVAAAHAANQIA